jgi:hypothetical protein
MKLSDQLNVPLFYLTLFLILCISSISNATIIKYTINDDKVLYIKESSKFIILKGNSDYIKDQYGMKIYQPSNDSEKKLIGLVQARSSNVYEMNKSGFGVWNDDNIQMAAKLYYDAKLEEDNLKTIDSYLFSVNNNIRIRTKDQAKFDLLIQSLNLKTIQDDKNDPIKIVQLEKTNTQNVFEIAEVINSLPYITFAYPIVENIKTRSLPGISKGETKIGSSGLVKEVKKNKEKNYDVKIQYLKESERARNLSIKLHEILTRKNYKSLRVVRDDSNYVNFVVKNKDANDVCIINPIKDKNEPLLNDIRSFFENEKLSYRVENRASGKSCFINIVYDVEKTKNKQLDKTQPNDDAEKNNSAEKND